MGRYNTGSNSFKTVLLVGALVLLAMVTLGAKDVDLRGMVRSYNAMTLSDADLAINEQTIDLKLEGWGDMTRLVVNPYAYVGLDSEPEIGIREAYVDLFFESMDVRIGKQAIVWGQAEGAFITDIVSPRDMRSFILADFTEIRMGIPALKADYYLGDYTFEGIWIPRFVPSSLPASDGLWAQEMTLPNGTPIAPSITEVGTTFEDSEVFGKISRFGSSLSWEVMGGYAWTDEPHVTNIDGPTATATQEYGRFAVVGGSFSMPLGPTVVRGEAALYLDKPFSSVTPAMPSPTVEVEKHHQVQSLLGVDWNLWGVAMSGQYILSYVDDHNATLMELGKSVEEFKHTFTFRMQDTYISDRLTAKVFVYLEPEPLNALIRPSLSWSIEDGVSIEGGLELFVGDEDGTFGTYSDNSLAYVSLRWYF